jgi:hypothetical protein
MLTAARAPDPSAIHYSLTASIQGGQLSMRHRIVNRSASSLCFFPDSWDIENAKISGAAGEALNNIHNAGFIAGRQTVYFAAADGKAHHFSYASDVAEVLLPAEADRARTLEFDFYGFDCGDLTSGRVRIKPIVRKTATAVISRAPPR